MYSGYVDPARNCGVFYLKFMMSIGYVKSEFELKNSKLWQVTIDS